MKYQPSQPGYQTFEDDQRSLGSDDQENVDQQLPPSKQIKRLVQQQEIMYNPNDEDFINKISQPMRAKTKGELLSKNLNKKTLNAY